MPSPQEGTVTHFYNQLRQGDGDGAEGLWQHFGPRLLGLARKTLADRPKRVTDADDAVQSAFVSFWQRAQRGDFTGDMHRDNLWNLLGTITVRKVLKQQEHEQAQKRGGGRVYSESAAAELGGEPFQLDQALGKLPAQEFDLICEDYLLQLDEGLRAIALLKMMNYKNAEIAEVLECSVSAVERKLKLIRSKWKREQ
ncbi:MAG: sigma-70 family RNA polymerase sigma factor [Planctomycetaceae bacterium]|jgi:RNA polymerase sigma factor (sigma-70 family)|nr:sigma-70 family RNA polymerase sigma factor [Planctomycetaceae bacterium]MBT6486472.1 sigma-70 family RNA polymerase sigma factor [Planctomycetaceae bacterium]MBT6493433.1 sigma-70 family RNA polymerase sigma factor [Planctomycetaceae bacterium]